MIRWIENDACYMATKLLPSGMTAYMLFYEPEDDSGYAPSLKAWNVEMSIAPTGTSLWSLWEYEGTITGRDGLIPASFFLQVLTSFEGVLKSGREGVRNVIEVGACAKRNWEAYKKVLIPRGYSVFREYEEKPLMVKEIRA